MSTVTRRVKAQGAATASVLVAGIVVSALSGGGAAAVAAPKHHALSTAHASTATSDTTPVKTHFYSFTPKSERKAAHAPKPQLRHNKHEAWSKLLAHSPHGWSVTHAASSVSVGQLSQNYLVPSAAKSQLKFDGYRRGVVVGQRGGQVGTVEQIWQFRRPTGATAWFAGYIASNRPGPKSLFNKGFVVGRRGMGYTAKKPDSMGYHFGEALTLEGDMIVATRVFSTRPISQKTITHQARVEARPVGKGITRTDLLSALSHTHGVKKAPAIHT